MSRSQFELCCGSLHNVTSHGVSVHYSLTFLHPRVVRALWLPTYVCTAPSLGCAKADPCKYRQSSISLAIGYITAMVLPPQSDSGHLLQPVSNFLHRIPSAPDSDHARLTQNQSHPINSSQHRWQTLTPKAPPRTPGATSSRFPSS